MELRPRIGELKLRDVPKCDLLRLFTAPAYKAKFPWHIQTLYIEHGSFERLNLPFNFFSGVSASLQTLTLIGVEIPAGMFLPFLANLSYHGYPVLPRATHDDECNGMDHMRLPPGEDLHLRHLSKLLPRKLSSLESSFHLPLLERLCIRTDSRECLQILSRLPIPLYTCVEIQSRGMLTLEDPPIANYFEAYLVNTSGSYLMSISTHHPQNHRDRSAVMQLHEVQDMYEADVEEVGGELNTSAPFLKMSLGTLSTTSKLERALARISPNSISGLELHASLLDKWDRDTVWKIFNKFQSVTYLHLLGEEAMYICAALIPREITPDGPTVAPGSAASTVLFPELTELHFTCVSFPPWEAGHTVEPYASLTGIFWSRWEKLGTILQRMILTSCTGWEEHVERWQEYAVDPIIAEPTQESSEPSPSASEGVWA
ncbi:unnamed protein product [Peniophora sp. CBMAI 1063]|nr:unnamed protein product [Peniophora sp. CBMAI 1063]